ncbi:MAG TPA: hypothetical protein VN833_32930, partial [Candidatus Acidoferrales bacterium]|nr:hypothetical protein [Candidatus Acidoferrales bacterium]
TIYFKMRQERRGRRVAPQPPADSGYRNQFKPRSGSLSEHRSHVAAEDDEILYVDPTGRF